MGFKKLESIHLLAQVGGVILTSGVAVSLKHLRSAKIIFPVLALYDLKLC
jgi:hypothetical protein